MMKINRSILIICIVSLFLIIGQISASDTDSMEITDTINKGGISTIVFYIDGESIGEAVVAWPLEGDLCLVINGVVLNRKGRIK